MSTEHKSNTATEIRDLWKTPKYIFDYYDRRFNFVCDVAASEENKLCNKYIGESANALHQAGWEKVNWCNPPYSDITPWVECAVKFKEIYNQTTVMIIPSDTSVKWFKLAFDNCTECHFISGRISFINNETGKPVNGNNKGSVVFIFDPKSPVKQSVHLIDRESMKL